jgi:hypothetical protein
MNVQDKRLENFILLSKSCVDNKIVIQVNHCKKGPKRSRNHFPIFEGLLRRTYGEVLKFCSKTPVDNHNK